MSRRKYFRFRRVPTFWSPTLLGWAVTSFAFFLVSGLLFPPVGRWACSLEFAVGMTEPSAWFDLLWFAGLVGWIWSLVGWIWSLVRGHVLSVEVKIICLRWWCGFANLSKTSITPSGSGPIPAQKIRGISVPRVVFSHTMPKIDFYHSHRYRWEKTH